MGLLSKYTEWVAGPAPDMPALMGSLLASDDTFLSWATVTPAAGEADTSGGVSSDPLNRLLNVAVNSAMAGLSARKHISGEEGSIARTLPRDSGALTMVVSKAGLSAWRGDGYRGNIPEAYYRIAAEHITTVTDTGQRGQGKTVICRVDFVDGSYFDFRLYVNAEEFLQACRTLW